MIFSAMRTRAHLNPFSVLNPSERPDWRQVFPGREEIDLEIGSANGHWLCAYAERFPGRVIVGVETRNIFINPVKAKLCERGLNNAAILRANINTAGEVLFGGVRLGHVFIMFPDPWYKSKHLRRRVVTPEFVRWLADKMVPAGELHIATDREGFAREMDSVISAESRFVNKAGKGLWVDGNIDGVVSSIESYHLERGHPVYRLCYRRHDTAADNKRE